MNRLSNEKSEYLKQHSTNPVDWYPWGEEAFAKARAENKPIFLSSGYSSCHWCHVMEKESFSHPKIAEILNQFYVPIKLDREERPDIDAIYMKAVQAMTGQGGWPLNVWLSPDLRPFFGGTYFPPEPRYGQPAFQDVLTQVHQAFHEQPEAVKKNSDSLMNILVQSGQYFEPKEDVHSSELVQISVKNLKQLADKENGGFGKAPKFFYSDGLRILLKASVVFQDREALAIAEKSLIKMACGGVYDQVGGGFHRYSTDEEWTIPHFEKMLYDNALMARVYLEAYQRTQNQFYSEMAVEILNFCLRDFKNPKAGFASTIDADSADGEGYFYSWSVEELRSLFNEEDFQFIYSHFGFHKSRDFNGRQVLCLESPLSTSGKLRFSKIRDILLKTRNLRKHPLVDTKLQTGWNSLLITSLAQCGFHLGRPDLLAEAENCLEFIWENAWSEKGLAHFLYGEEPSEVCLFEDSAYLAEALSALISCTGKSIYSDRLFELLNKISEDFYDSESGGFWSTSDRQVDVPVRSKEILDSALPSPYSVALQAFSFASDLTGDRQYSEVFNRSLQLVLGTAEKQVGGFSRLAVCLLEREGQKTNSFCTPETCGT